METNGEESKLLLTLLNSSKELFQLNLEGLTILTEAANGFYYVTPIIAALAGAKVIAFTKDSAYGSVEKVQELVFNKAKQVGVSERITFIDNLAKEDLRKVSIVTNSGHLRPLNRNLLKSLSQNSVIALMYESWEIRPEDIDLEACKEIGIPIVGVNEETELCNIFRYVGNLALKMMLDAGMNITGKKILIVSSDKFGTTIKTILDKCDAETALLDPEDLQYYQITSKLPDVIVIADQSRKSTILGGKGVLTAQDFKKKFPETKILHIAGGVDTTSFTDEGIFCYPQKVGYAQKMSETLAYLGVKPVIELHTAALKAAQLVLTARNEGIAYLNLKKYFFHDNLCQIL